MGVTSRGLSRGQCVPAYRQFAVSVAPSQSAPHSRGICYRARLRVTSNACGVGCVDHRAQERSVTGFLVFTGSPRVLEVRRALDPDGQSCPGFETQQSVHCDIAVFCRSASQQDRHRLLACGSRVDDRLARQRADAATCLTGYCRCSLSAPLRACIPPTSKWSEWEQLGQSLTLLAYRARSNRCSRHSLLSREADRPVTSYIHIPAVGDRRWQSIFLDALGLVPGTTRWIDRIIPQDP